MTTALIFLAIIFLSPNLLDAQNVGVCYGTNGDNLPSAQATVNLCKKNGISKMRLYSPDISTLQALQGSGITIILDIPTTGNSLQLIGTNASAASHWVQTYVVPFSTIVKYIAVGNEIMPHEPIARYILPAMQNVQKAINVVGLSDQIKVSTIVKSLVLSNTFPPSSGSFGSNNSYFTPIVKFLKSNGSPLLTSIYPYFSFIANRRSISLNCALFTSSSPVVTDFVNGVELHYQNLFDTIIDSFYAALESANGYGIKIVVSKTGWPSKGGDEATPTNAAMYYKNLLRHVRMGTPRKPGQPLESYLFAMYDEKNNEGDEVNKHFGLFTPDQQNKYEISSFSDTPMLLGSLCYD